MNERTIAPPKPSARLRRIVVALALLGCAVLGLAVLTADPLPGGAWQRLAVLAAAALAVAVGELPFMRMRFGGSHLSFTLAPAALTISLVLLPWQWAALLAVVASAAEHAWSRRGLLKSAFNTANSVCSLVLAAAVASLAGPTGQVPASALAFLALAVGVVVGSTVSDLALEVVIATAQDVPVKSVAGRSVGVGLLTNAVNAGLGLAVVFVAHASPEMLGAVPVVAILLVLVHRANLRDQEENGVWRQLEDAGRELKTLDENDIVVRAVSRAAALTHCDRVELVLRHHDEPGQVIIHRGGLRGVSAQTIEAGPLTLARNEGRPTPARSPGGDTVVEVTLAGPGGGIGLLRVTFAGDVVVRERELQVLTTYSRTVASTLLNARLYADAVAEAELKAWQAGHDTLTGLPNRTGLMELSEEVEDSAARTGELFAVLVLNVDHFKQVNDTLGRDSGDRLLQHLSAVLADRVRRGDVAARLEGDAFAVLLRRLPDEATVDGIAQDVLRCVSEPVEHEDLRLSLESTLGFAVAPSDGATLELLLKRAELAMTHAKSSPGSSRRWRSERDDQSRDRLALSADLRAALAAGDEVLLHYQPQVDLVTGGVRSVEVLARWQHPTRGLLMPAEFVPVAERSGLARPFTLAVLDLAVREAADWKALGLGDGEVSVAVNLSARNLLDRELPGDIAVVLARHGLPARQLILEITETVAMSELEVVTDVLARLRTLGVQLSVDDFGTGYSSLKFLQAIAVNEIKIDREFVSGMLDSEQDAAIVKATVELGHGLGLRVVAEGVEGPAHLEAVRALGCDAAQGWHVSRPVPGAQLREMLLPADGSVVPLRAARRRLGTA